MAVTDHYILRWPLTRLFTTPRGTWIGGTSVVSHFAFIKGSMPCQKGLTICKIHHRSILKRKMKIGAQIILWQTNPLKMPLNDPKIMYVLSTFQTPSYLNYCLLSSDDETKRFYSQAPQKRHQQHHSWQNQPKVSPRVIKLFNKQIGE